MDILNRRHAYGTLTLDTVHAVMERLQRLLIDQRFVVVEYRTSPEIVMRPRILPDRTLSTETFPFREVPIYLTNEGIWVCTKGERWLIEAGAAFDFSGDVEAVRFHITQFDHVLAFMVQEQYPEDAHELD